MRNRRTNSVIYPAIKLHHSAQILRDLRAVAHGTGFADEGVPCLV